ncbi:hypothetical protein L6R52_06600 [Myxococcota bacterium]|nr:hypothetical protein [Myxococcota bacterium]
MGPSSVKNLILAGLLSLGAALATGCKSDAPKPAEPAKSAEPAKAATHAPAGVEPGSHEDWCGEHAVPESLCTRCNPQLAAAFKATGDWCEEHGLPESQCKLCNPGLKIERPPKK